MLIDRKKNSFGRIFILALAFCWTLTHLVQAGALRGDQTRGFSASPLPEGLKGVQIVAISLTPEEWQGNKIVAASPIPDDWKGNKIIAISLTPEEWKGNKIIAISLIPEAWRRNGIFASSFIPGEFRGNKIFAFSPVPGEFKGTKIFAQNSEDEEEAADPEREDDPSRSGVGGVTKVSDNLREEVLRLEVELQRELSETEQAQAAVNKVRSDIARLESNMNWMERKIGWLAKRFGGDALNIDELRTLRKERVRLEGDLEKDQLEDQQANDNVVAEIDSWLRSNDEKFRKLREVEANLNTLVCQGNDCLALIARAIEEADEAHDTEFLDAVTDSDAIDVISHFETAEARQFARKAQASTQNYIKAIQRQKKDWETGVVREMTTISDTELMMDLVFDFSFDFFSFSNMSKLENMMDDLEEMHGQVKGIADTVEKEYQGIKEQLDEAVCQVRNICNEGQ